MIGNMDWVQKHTALVLFALVLTVGVFLAPQVGLTWDEADNIFAGGVYATFFKEGLNPHAFDGFWDQRSLFHGTIYTQNPTLEHYPPVPIYVGTGITLLSRLVGYGYTGPQIVILFHVATALFFAILVSTVYRFAILLELSPATAVFAGLATYFYPTLFGHGLTNLKDTAQVSLFTLAMYYLVRFIVRRKQTDIIVGAVVWGLGLSTKMNAIYVPVIWGVWTLFHKKYSPLFMMYCSLLVMAIGLAIAFITWPYLWFDPVNRAIAVIQYFATIGQGYTIFWNGVSYLVGEGKPLWWYPWASLFFMSPQILLILAVVGGLRVLWEGNRKRRLLLIWLIVPPLRAILPNAAFYDGLRHFMEILPAFILLSAVGVSGIWSLVKSRTVHILYPVILGAILGYMAIINYQYFPYSTGYYNVFTPHPNINFDRDIEGLAVGEAVAYLNGLKAQYNVWIPIASHVGWNYVSYPNQIVRDMSMGNIVIVINKSSHIRNIPELRVLPELPGFVLDHVISRGSAVFGWIYKRK